MTLEYAILNDQDCGNFYCTNENEEDCDYFATLAEEMAQAMLDDDEPEDATAENAGKICPPKYWGALKKTEEPQIPILQKVSFAYPGISALHHGSETLHLSAAETERSLAIHRYNKIRSCSASAEEQESSHQLHGKYLPAKARSRRDTASSQSNSMQKNTNASVKSPLQGRGEDAYLCGFNQGSWQAHPIERCNSLKMHQRRCREMLTYFNNHPGQAAPLPVPYLHHPLDKDFHAMQVGMRAAFLSCPPSIGTGVFLPRTGSNCDKIQDCGVKLPKATQCPRHGEAGYYRPCGYL